MAEPTRNAGSRSLPSSDEAASRAAFPSDVLLIADGPRVRKNGRNGRVDQAGVGSVPDSPTEPFDMESVVRRLIALLSEETRP